MTALIAVDEFISNEKTDLIKTTICKGANDDELQLFVGVCNRLRLDPFARQIFYVKRWDASLRKEVGTPQVSIDGFRIVADRSGKYAGQTEPQWCGKDGVWTDIWVSDEPPVGARIGVIRSDFQQPLYAVARYKAYVQTKKEGGPNAMWAKMPDLMLSKCAEALALRKAFPNDLSGVYTPEEMGQAENHVHSTLVQVHQLKPQQTKRELILRAATNVLTEEVPEPSSVPAESDVRRRAMMGIGSAAEMPELESVGEWVKTAALSEQDLKDVREAYKRKLEFLQKQAQQQYSIIMEHTNGDDTQTEENE